jgi:hypothetical protein
MMVDKITELVIYESPDGGQTIYKRQSGHTERELVSISPEKQAQQSEQDRWIMWRDILTASRLNPALQTALEQAQIIYELSKSNE